jgi:hypothetical protein
MTTDSTMNTGMTRVLWVWGLGYTVIVTAFFAAEFTSDYTTFESLRQDAIAYEEEADIEGPTSILRADSRRALPEFYNIRTFGRISGCGNRPVVLYEGDTLSSMTAGAGWAGAITELASLVFPALDSR